MTLCVYVLVCTDIFIFIYIFIILLVVYIILYYLLHISIIQRNISRMFDLKGTSRTRRAEAGRFDTFDEVRIMRTCTILYMLSNVYYTVVYVHCVFRL